MREARSWSCVFYRLAPGRPVRRMSPRRAKTRTRTGRRATHHRPDRPGNRCRANPGSRRRARSSPGPRRPRGPSDFAPFLRMASLSTRQARTAVPPAERSAQWIAPQASSARSTAATGFAKRRKGGYATLGTRCEERAGRARMVSPSTVTRPCRAIAEPLSSWRSWRSGRLGILDTSPCVAPSALGQRRRDGIVDSRELLSGGAPFRSAGILLPSRAAARSHEGAAEIGVGSKALD